MAYCRLINLLCFLMAVANCNCESGSSVTTQQPWNRSSELPEVHGNKFYYFGFGSNMLAKRIHIQNPTARRIGSALLENYRLDFDQVGQRWKGAVATIVPTPNYNTWGVVWEIDLSNLADIDNQEGVHLGLYEPISVTVYMQGNNSELPARAYMLTQQPKTNLFIVPIDEVPESRQPSKTYLQCLVKGAIENNIPEVYVNRLRAFKHNGRVAKDLEELLELQDVEV